MAEVLPPPTTSSSSSSPHSSQSPVDSSDSVPSLPHSRPQPRERVPSYAQNRMSQYSRSSQRSRPQSNVEYPAFSSSLSFALVRDFAYPVYHPLHYGAELEPSGASTPGSEWNSSRRQSDPLDQWNHGAPSHSGGRTAGPWGGDGVMYGDPDHDSDLAALPSTSFGNEEDDELVFKTGKHRKSKSYASISDYERGRRRESERRSGAVADPGMFYFHGQQTDPAGRDSLRQSRASGNSGIENGGRRDSRFAATLPNRSFHNSYSVNHEELDEDDQIPLDSEPHDSHSPVRDSMGPEDEELFAGPSLALYAFEPENSNELRLIEGQEIMVSYRHGQGWLVAADPRTGEQGLVPEAYVRLISDMPNYDPETGQFVDVDEFEEDSEDNEDDGSSGKERNHGELVADGQPVQPVDDDERLYGDGVEEDSGSPSPVELTAKKLDRVEESEK